MPSVRRRGSSGRAAPSLSGRTCAPPSRIGTRASSTSAGCCAGRSACRNPSGHDRGLSHLPAVRACRIPRSSTLSPDTATRDRARLSPLVLASPLGAATLGPVGHAEADGATTERPGADRWLAANLVTLNPDGSPEVTCVWVGLEDDEIVSGHLRLDQRKLRNIARDPRIALSIEGDRAAAARAEAVPRRPWSARLVEGGAPQLLQRLAHVYLGPDVTFPPMADPPPGSVIPITVERIGGVGPWSA